jgi:hypothetical protein
VNRRIVGIFALAAALGSTPAAFAAQNVANTSQQGSLLIFPLINIEPANDAADTLVEISNDNIKPVHIECEYVNETKGRVDFDFTLTAKATASWDVYSGAGDNVSAPQFPSNGSFQPGSPYPWEDPNIGELVCFAVNKGGTEQIAWNHLTGNATIVYENDSDANQSKQAFKYNAWSFIARNATGGPTKDGTQQGTPGTLVLAGSGAGTYDACPAYNTVNFMPNGATLDPVTTLDSDLAVVSCNQDLRQDFHLHLTKLDFTVWNAQENSFTGSDECVDSNEFIGLSSGDNSVLVNPSNFDYSTLRTADARFQVQGDASSVCPPVYDQNAQSYASTENAGLLGVISSSTGINDYTTEDAEVGTTTNGAGATTGFVLWDPAGSVQQIRK